MSRSWQHHEVCRVADLVGDPAALGGAVTVALCGHWEHEGPCRWEHFTHSHPEGDGFVTTVWFDASEDEQEHVRQLVREAVATGALTGPDGTPTTWRPVP